MSAELADGSALTGVALTEAQEGIWYASQADPSHPGYNTGHAVELRGSLDVSRFARAIAAAHAESAGLAVQVVDTEDGPRLVPSTRTTVLEVVDLTGHDDPHAAAVHAMQADMDRPRALDRDALVVQRLFVLGPAHWLWYEGIHHILIDGYGTLLLMRRICELYDDLPDAGHDAESLPLPGMAMGAVADVQADDARYRAGTLRERDRRFWHEQFVRRPEITSLSASRAPAARHARMASTALPSALLVAVHALAEQVEVPWPDVLVAFIAAYLTRHTGHDEIVIGVPYMGRLGTPAARVPTMTMNVLPMRLALDEAQTVQALVADVSDRLRIARRHGRYRSEQLRRDLHLVGGDRHVHGPIVNVLPFEEAVVLRDVVSSHVVLGTGPVDDLAIAVRGGALGLAGPDSAVDHATARLEFEANPDRYSAADVEAHLVRLSTFLQRAVQANTLAVVPTLTDDEQQRWVHAVNDTAHAVAPGTLVDLIDATVQRQPDAPALRADGRTLSYAQLDAQARDAAAALTALGVRRGDVVALAIPRSLDLSIVMLGVLRVGAAYMPIEGDQPTDRVAVMLAEARPRLVVTSAAFSAVLPDTVAQVRVHGGVIDVAGQPTIAGIAPERPTGSDAAYVIFTSGSTGIPKGVVVEHAAIVNRLEWMRTHYGIGAGDHILQKTPVTFDVSVWELFLPFVSGATLVMAPPESHRDPAWLARVIDEEHISVMHFVPSMLSAFLADQESAANRVRSLRQVFCSGEALTAEQRDRFHVLYQTELHNLYGPTEAAVDVTYWPAARDDRSDPVPIGFPVWNTAMYVLDARRRAVPSGVPGDLYIAGVQLARGYLNRPEFTEERFVADPFVAGERMYLTGDKAMWRADGALTYLGRSDHQVKIRGVRIEPGEIESVIMGLGGFAQAHVVPRVMTDGETRLVAYVVPATGSDVAHAANLRTQLQQRLPEAMVPSYVMAMDTLPLTSSGKLDRKALPLPEQATGTGRQLSTVTEHAVATLFADLLQLDVSTLHADDDFFLLGGHSLLAASAMVRLRVERQLTAGIGALFANPTVARFARFLDEVSPATTGARAQSEGLGPTVLLVDGGDAMTSGQPPLFCVHPAGGISWCYAALGRALGRTGPHPRSVYGLQADLHGGAQPETLRAMATDYVQRIRAIQPSGPYHLAGWSVGGIIAQEMAVQLQEAGAVVGSVTLMDAYPSDHWRLAPPPAEGAALDALLLIAGIDPASMNQSDRSLESVIGLLRQYGHPLGTLSDATLGGVLQVVESNNRLVRGHEQRRFDGPLLHLRAALDHGDGSYLATEWAPYARTVHAHDIPSLHAHMTSSEHAALVASLMHPAMMASSGMVS
ncbi:MAG TPA: amino acid adenylation domain-containing protein [Gemmatimonas sp.]|uniref:amino acid adenylation domain-containing protein n=1 Tax=Gemmatimonas sp. TaxID=1962908 RepID=UPI002EDB5699